MYDNGHGKQADSSYVPRNMPLPSRHNLLKYRPNSDSIFPTTVFECAVTNESRDRLLSDADEKHFSINTSIMVWIGLKVKLNADRNSGTFWLGWGRRRAIGWGLRLMEQSEDDAGNATFLPIRSALPLDGELTVPTQLIFDPSQPPANCPDLLITFEDVRQAILDGLSFL